MKKEILRYFSKFIKLSIVILLVFVIARESKTTEVRIVNENLNRTLDLTSMSERVYEDIANNLYAALDTYTGHLTGYAADCPLCGGRLSCAPNYTVLKNGVTTYPDALYGDVYIVASSKSLPCGTIVKFDSKRISDEPVIAIVLDRGVRGQALDILMATGEEARTKIGRSTITYDVIREGWER